MGESVEHECDTKKDLHYQFASMFKGLNLLIITLLKLGVFEARLAGISVMTIFSFLIGIALLITTIWVLIMAALSLSLFYSGYDWVTILFFMAMLNIIIILFLIYGVFSLFDNLKFKATRNALKTQLSLKEEKSNV